MNKKKAWAILLLILLFAFAIRMVFFQGAGTSDALMNTRYSHDIMNGKFPTNANQANARLGLLVPASVIYSAFGVNEFSSAAYPLALSLFWIVLAFLFGLLLFNEKVGLMAAFLLSIFPLDVLYATRLMSDLPSAVFGALSIYLFLMAEKTAKNSKFMLYALSGLALGFSFSIREMTIVTMLFFIVYALYNRKVKASYFLVLFSFLIVLLAEMYVFYHLTGNPFYRFNSLSNYHSDPAVATDFYGRLTFPKFFITWPYVLFGSIQLGFFFGFIFLALSYWLFNRKKEADYLLMWFISTSLYFYFGSTSLTRFAPILAVDRYLNYLTIPGILLLASFLSEKDYIIKKIIMPFAIIFLFLTSAGALYLDDYRHGEHDLRAAYGFLKTTKGTILTDQRSKDVFDFLEGYQKKLDIKSFNYFDPYSNATNKNALVMDLSNASNSYIVVNKWFMNIIPTLRREIRYPEEIYNPPKKWVVVKEIGSDPDKKVVIYYAK